MLAMTVLAQQGQLDIVGTHPAGYGRVRFFDPAATLGGPKIDSFSYAEVEGSPFLDDRWASGSLQMIDGKSIPFARMRYNSYNGEVHYMDAQGQEMAAGVQQLHGFTIMKPKNAAELNGRFEAMTDMFSDDRRSFYRILNDGKFRLVVLDRTTVKKTNFDPLLGKRELHFVNRVWYGIAEYEYIHPIFILDHDRISKELELKPEQEKWLKEHRNSLKNEADVIAFLTYLNDSNKK